VIDDPQWVERRGTHVEKDLHGTSPLCGYTLHMSWVPWPTGLAKLSNTTIILQLLQFFFVSGDRAPCYIRVNKSITPPLTTWSTSRGENVRLSLRDAAYGSQRRVTGISLTAGRKYTGANVYITPSAYR
jgi:hypothetical protein